MNALQFDFESKWNELSGQNSNPDGEGGEGCPSSMPDEIQVIKLID